MKKYILVIWLLVMGFVNVFGQNVFGQNDDTGLISKKGFKKENKDLDFEYLVGIKNLNSIEVGIAKSINTLDKYNLFFPNVHLSPEVSFANSDVVLGTKIGFSATYAIINVGSQFIHYTDFINQDFAIRPEIGFSFLGILDLVYGYNFQLYSKQIQSISNNTLTLRFTTSPWLGLVKK